VEEREREGGRERGEESMRDGEGLREREREKGHALARSLALPQFNSPTRALALLDWRWPMKCHRMSDGRAGALSRSSYVMKGQDGRVERNAGRVADGRRTKRAPLPLLPLSCTCT